MQDQQIRSRSVEITWVFTQTIFMGLNTMLWTLSYAEVRAAHRREEVEHNLRLALEEIRAAVARWPGVESAAQLYDSLIVACLQIYNEEGDIPIMATSPNDSLSHDKNASNRSIATTPSTIGLHKISDDASRGSIGSTYQADILNTMPANGGLSVGESIDSIPSGHIPPLQSYPSVDSQHAQYTETLFNPLPEVYDPYQWDNVMFGPPGFGSVDYVNLMNPEIPYAVDLQTTQYGNFPDLLDAQRVALAQSQGHAQGLTRQQQMELMQDLEKSGMGHLEMMIEKTSAFFNAGARG